MISSTKMNLQQFCRLTFCIYRSVKFCPCCHDDYLQKKMNIYCSYLLCLLVFSFIRRRNKRCKYHVAIRIQLLSYLISHKVADENVGCESCATDFIEQFSRATKPCSQKSANFVIHLTSALVS